LRRGLRSVAALRLGWGWWFDLRRRSVDLRGVPQGAEVRFKKCWLLMQAWKAAAPQKATSRSGAALKLSVVPTFRKRRERWGTHFSFPGCYAKIQAYGMPEGIP